ncbi:MAG: hypothetical protein K5877_10515 [Lachnospiraceae bacterium]|nr:hypothetical protein [Lachnospiraceae bacterium]
MYCEIQTLEITKDAVKADVIDLDEVLLNGWDKDFNAATSQMVFPLESRGARVYLYKICRSNKKTAECSTMEEMVNIALAPGTIINISSNFMVKE